jgi:hypothetical protein
MRTFLAFIVAAVLFPATQAPAPATTTGAGKVWVGKYAEYEEFLKTAPIDKITDVPIGVTKPRRAYFKPGGLAESAVVKDLQPGRKAGYWESYKSEIAAYELDKLLELDMVPPTVERRIDGQNMSAQLWVHGLTEAATLNGKPSPDAMGYNRQLYRQRVFDNLIANIDENKGNLLVLQSPKMWELVLVDHSRCFTETTKMQFPMTKIDRTFYDKIKSLDAQAVADKIGPYVLDKGKGVMKRRDVIVQEFEKLAAKNGEAAVFIK